MWFGRMLTHTVEAYNLIPILVQLSDFGLAVTGGNSNKANIKLSGTLGYVAPEYLLDGKDHFPILSICMV